MALNLSTAAAICERLGLDSSQVQTRAVGGGDIAQASLIQAGGQTVFIKTLALEHAGLLAAEADGLAALRAAAAARVPQVLGCGEAENLAWLALEGLDLQSRSGQADACLGRQLADLHRRTGDRFGWQADNFIGLTPQPNTPTDDWAAFFGDRRLGYQMERLARNRPEALSSGLIDRALRRWEQLAADHQPAVALLHGDLWSGNAAALADQEPVIFDPAVHYGDRECDLAMSALFGGFSTAFYRSYENAWPLPAGWEARRPWYQFYHLLNHANLFGGGYLSRARHELAALIG